MDTIKRIAIFLPLLVLFTGCSGTPKPKSETKAAEPAKPAEPVSGRVAFHRMYLAARAWAPDAQLLRLASIHLQGSPEGPGLSGTWESTFVSARLAKARSFTFSVLEGPGNLHKGVFTGQDQGYSGPSGQNKPFDIAAFKTDSDAACKVAMDEGKEYAKKNPNMTMLYILESTKRFPDPVWRIVWGESVGTSGFSVYVDAVTGRYLEKMY